MADCAHDTRIGESDIARMGDTLAANVAVLLVAMTAYALLKVFQAHMAQQHWAGGAVTAVLVTSTTDELGYPRLPFLLSSLCQHMSAPGLLEELLVVTPDRDVQALTDALLVTPYQSLAGSAWERGGCRPPWPVRVLPDSAVLPTARDTLSALTAASEQPGLGGRGAGYRMQMLIKLGVAKRECAAVSIVSMRHPARPPSVAKFRWHYRVLTCRLCTPWAAQ
jgi:hypothetical protein